MSPPFISPVPNHGPFEYFGGGGAVAGGGFAEHEAVQAAVDLDPVPPPGWEGLPEEVIQKITKQVGAFLIFWFRYDVYFGFDMMFT